MTKILWDQTGEKKFETGVDHGVLFLRDETGAYTDGVAWNGLTTVTQSPSGAESNKHYADNQVYLNLVSNEEYSATIEAFTYPDEWEQCDGSVEVVPGVTVGQQDRAVFGFSWRSLIGNDTQGTRHGFKIHLVWGGQAAPSERAHETINENVEPMPFSWEVSTTPVAFVDEANENLRPTAHIAVDSTKISAAKLKELTDILYGTEGQDPRLPSPDEVIAIIGNTTTSVSPTTPNYDQSTKVLTIPTKAGVDYYIAGAKVPAGTRTLTQDTGVTAKPAPGYKFPNNADDYWLYKIA